jgi:hypothetical protein
MRALFHCQPKDLGLSIASVTSKPSKPRCLVQFNCLCPGATSRSLAP